MMCSIIQQSEHIWDKIIDDTVKIFVLLLQSSSSFWTISMTFDNLQEMTAFTCLTADSFIYSGPQIWQMSQVGSRIWSLVSVGLGCSA